MSKRYLLIGIATLVAVALFALTLMVDTPHEQGTTARGPINEGPPDVAPYFDPDRAAGADEGIASPELFQEVTRGQYRFRDGRRDTLLFYDRVTPQPHGILDVEQPIAQIYFSAEQVLEIRADACTFIAPENQPRGGAFRGNVVVTLFETDDGSPVAFDNPDHIQLRTYLDEATFDLDLGQLESDSDVELVGREVAFRGTGLSMIYNELRRRIERLEIARGEMLRFTPRREVDEANDHTNDTSEAHTPRSPRRNAEGVPPQPTDEPTTTATAHTTADADDTNTHAATDPATTTALADADAATDAATADADPELFYRARFEQDVRVEAEGGAVRLAADALDAVFTLRSTDWGPSTSRSPNHQPQTTNHKPTPPTRYATARADTNATTADAPVIVDDAAPPAMLDESTFRQGPADDDRTVTIYWTGPMILEPEHDPDPALVGPEDLLLQLVGQPARLDTADHEQLTANQIQYITSTGHVRATGTVTAPVHLISNEMGELQAVSLELDQQNATGIIQGPGWLTNRTSNSNSSNDTGDTTANTGDAIRVAWHDQLDLTFFPDDSDADADAPSDSAGLRPGVRLAGLDTARFHGNVEVNHPQFDLDAGRLALHMHPPADNRQAIRHIDADDNAYLRAAIEDDADPDARAIINASALAVAFELDDTGTSHARRLSARESVVAEHPQWRLEAGEVVAELAQADADEATPMDEQADAAAAPSPTDAFARGANVQRLTAERDVRFTLIEEATELAGHRMVVHVPDDTVELFADPDHSDANPARLIRDDATLAGPHITLAQQDRSLHVQGPGWLDTNLDPDDPDARLMVSWNDALHYDDTTGRAHVVGQVQSQSTTTTNRTRLTANDLKFHLVAAEDTTEDTTTTRSPQPNAVGFPAHTTPFPANPIDFTPVTPEPTNDQPDVVAASFDRRHIRTATADGDATFRAETLDPDTGQRVSYIQLEGPTLHFDGDAEQLTVPGPGRMSLVDTRSSAPNEKPETTNQEPAPTPDTSPVNFTGRGVTVFDWQRQLTLDAANNTALFEQDVQMLHQPPDDGPHIQLDAQRLLADFVETGGLANWIEGDAADPQLNLVRADGNIRIIHGDRTIVSDHLQYTADDDTVRLWADAGNYVEVSRADQPSPLTAESLWWDLARDRFEARRPGPTIIPMPAASE
ncbi:hypothetical protein ACERK3_15910 [Phycisphaerales bacterium AB-hyl4]|uniref:LPS export ABC transporter periplasmic protein LptC n=1 Tax=Natronomicrosphaera hydrolytica TaxID=3242702 RepID=A0ABV4UAB2_9BACT